MALSIVQFALAQSSDAGTGNLPVTLAANPSVGNTLVAMGSAYEGLNQGSGWTVVSKAPFSSGFFGEITLKEVTATDALSATVEPFTNGPYGWLAVVYEVSGTVIVGASECLSSQSGNPFVDPVLAYTQSSLALSFVTNNSATQSVTSGSGWTQDGTISTQSGHIASGWAAHRQYTGSGTGGNTTTFSGSTDGITSALVFLVSNAPVIVPVIEAGLDVPPKYRLVVYDLNGNIVIVPQDVIAFSFEDVVNGGSGQGSFVLKRQFVDQGWCDYQYRVQLYLGASKYPWYDGRIIEIDPQQFNSNDSETITIQTEGWSTQMAYAIVSEILTPGATVSFEIINGVNTQIGGSMNADTYLIHLLGTYLDNMMFGSSYVASIPLALDGLTFDGQELNTCIDAVVKQITDVSGQIYEWWVRGGIAGTLPSVVIQPQQDPGLVTGPSFFAPGAQTPTNCIVEFKDETIYEYQVQNSSRSIYNIIALYGGTLNGVQVYGAFKDSTSQALYGTREKKITNSVLLSTTTLGQYGAAWLASNAYPQPSISFFKVYPSDLARAGQWFQVMEGAAKSYDGYRFIDYVSTQVAGQKISRTSGSDLDLSTVQGLKQMRAIRVLLTLQEGVDRIEQQVFATAPRPFIDHAYYGGINYIAGRTAAAQGFAGPTQLSSYYMLNGPVPVQNTPASNIIPDSFFLQGTVYDGNNRAVSPYSLTWSFSYIDNVAFYISRNANENNGIMQFLNDSNPCRALSGSFPFLPGTYSFSYQLNMPSLAGGLPRWSIVADRGSGVSVGQYPQTYIYSLNAQVGGPSSSGVAFVVSGSYVNTSTTVTKARLMFELNGYTGNLSTAAPVLAYVPA